jgi:crotonyl-CoA carboxylase/reductase
MWMHQKRLQGSHFANLKQASSANKLMVARRLDPCMSEVFTWADIPAAHTKMRKNQHKTGNMAVLVQSPKTGLRTFEDTIAESQG